MGGCYAGMEAGGEMNYGQFDEPIEVGDVVYFKVDGKEVAGDVVKEIDDGLFEVDTLEYGVLLVRLNEIYRLERW